MGLPKKFSKLSRKEFASLMIRALRPCCGDDELKYDADRFLIVRTRDGELAAEYLLGNAYTICLTQPRSSRAAFLRDWALTLTATERELPDDLALVRPNLRLKLWLRSGAEAFRLRAILDGEDCPSDWPGAPIGEHLLVRLVYDYPDSTRWISSAELDGWGTTFEDAFQVANENLARTFSGVITKMGELYRVDSGDSYDAARIATAEFVRRFDVAGRHVAMVPNRDTLLITGTENECELAMLAELAAEQLEEAEPLSGVPLVLDDDGWKDWKPPANHPLAGAFRELELAFVGKQSNDLKVLLDQLYEAQGVAVNVASWLERESKHGGKESLCVWSEGVETLLPMTDKVVLARAGQTEITALGDWERVLAVAGDLFEPTDYYPPRYRVRKFPDAAMLEKIGMGVL